MKSSILELNEKNIDVENFAKKAIKNEDTILELLKGIVVKSEILRFNSSKVLLIISEKNPETLYSKFSYFEKMLESKNAFHQCCAIDIIANLTSSDPENKFEGIFEKYYDIFKSEKTIPSAYLARNSGKIALARPDLREKITEKLLSIDKIHEGKQIELIKSHVIDSLNQYFEFAVHKEDIIEFVKHQLNSKSPKTRKAAQIFLTKWNLKYKMT